MRLQFAAQTDVGKVREHNEDNFLVDRNIHLYVVADGMGGHACGEVASAMAVKIVRENIARNREIIEEFQQGESTVSRRDILALIEHSIQHACYRIFEKGLESPRQRGMGTTLSMLLAIGDRGFIGHVGDSRLYLVREGQVHQLTEDHSLLNELLKHGKVKSLKDIDHRFKNAVTRAVGVYESVEVDTLDFDILPGDRFLLCSDGLHGYLDNETILEKLEGPDLNQIVAELTDYANRKGGKDNITSITIEALGDDAGDYTDVKLKFETLKGLSLFRYLNYQELVRVMNICTERSLAAGDTVFSEGDEEDCLYILLRGSVDILKSGVKLATLRSGVHFGEMALVDKARRSADAVCKEPSKVLVIQRKDFYDLMRKNSTLAVKMLWSFVKSLTSRLRSTNDELLRVKSDDSDGARGERQAWMASWIEQAPMFDLNPMAVPPGPTDGEGSGDGAVDEFPAELLPLADIRPTRPAEAVRTPPVLKPHRDRS
jgi:serine/threonine protein phosphatase PrpC